jgi:membrane-associated protease RseP (regulator of RpoE activity)
VTKEGPKEPSGLASEADLDVIVRSLFVVNDYYALEDGTNEYSVAFREGHPPKVAFRELFEQVSPVGYTPRLFGTEEDAHLTLTKTPPFNLSAPRIPVFLFLLSILALIATSWAMGEAYAPMMRLSPFEIGAIFAAGVVVVLTAREVVQRMMAQRKSRAPTLPYYIPNLPLFLALPVLYFVPTFGSITFFRAPAYDRDSLFDFYLVAPIVGGIVAFCVAIAGALNPLVLSQADYSSILGASNDVTLNVSSSLLQSGAISLAGASGLVAPLPSGSVSLFSPLEIAAWVGLLISFFSLLPAALFDGGRMSTLVLGERGSRITTLVTALVLVAIDVPNYWVVFLLIFLLAAIQPSNELLDSVSKISRSRRLLFLVAILFLALCVPLPQTFLSYHI